MVKFLKICFAVLVGVATGLPVGASLAYVGVYVAAATSEACTPIAGLPGLVDVEAYSATQDECVNDNDARAAVDACRAKARYAFCVQYPASENCPLDAGKE